MPARFIVLEGIDGSGKWTQVTLLKEYLEAMGKKVHILDFPRYKHESGFMVSKYLNGEYGSLEAIGPHLASIFYAIDRFDAKKETEEALATCDYVIANRYVSSNMIFQAAKLDSYEAIDTYLSWNYNLEFDIFGIPRPTDVFFLNISVQTSARLIAQKEQREYIKGGGNVDIHESDHTFLQRTANIAHYVAKKFTNWQIIECEENGEMLPREAITKKLLKKII